MRRTTDRIRNITARSPIALAGTIAACCLLAGPALAGGATPLPASDYTVRAACPQATPSHASCMAQELLPRTAAASDHSHPLAGTPSVRRQSTTMLTAAEGGYGFTPQGLHTAYLLPTTVASSQTIALVDAYNDPTAESDLESYEKEFLLPECSGCFKKLNEQDESGNLPYPQSSEELAKDELSKEASKRKRAEDAAGWGVEMSLDVDTARSICQNCKIILVEASSTSYEDLEAAERTAIKAGATEISNSWGGPESLGLEGAESPFNHPGTVITASAGDDGFLNWYSSEPGQANFPASSPHVVAVGGTHLEVGSETGAWKQELVWNGDGAGGGGCSEVFTAPSWQQSLTNWAEVGCGSGRSVSDVSADADPYTGVAVYDTDAYGCETAKNPHPGWCVIGGTSLASPLIAATFALAGGAHGVSYPAKTLYENEAKHSEALHDVTVGANGECEFGYTSQGISECTPAEAATQCSQHASCLAGVGYDGPTGVGTPDGVKAFEPPSSKAGEEEVPGKEKSKEEKAREEIGGEEVPTLELERILKEIAAHAPTVNPPPPAPPAPPSSGTPVQLSGLGLTLKAISALNRGRPRLSRIAFAFTSTVPLRVTVTLYEHVRLRHHTIWKRVGHPLIANAKLGRNSWHLAGRSTLSHGAYRLTLSAPGVTEKAVTFLIG